MADWARAGNSQIESLNFIDVTVYFVVFKDLDDEFLTVAK